jgi:hypothetical protein
MAPAAKKFPVFYPASRRVAYIATEAEITQLRRAGVLSTFGSKKALKGAVLFCGPVRPCAGTKYSHQAETKENPARVWTFTQIHSRDRDLFAAVTASCTATAAV